jgi:hypothetical protein
LVKEVDAVKKSRSRLAIGIYWKNQDIEPLNRGQGPCVLDKANNNNINNNNNMEQLQI